MTVSGPGLPITSLQVVAKEQVGVVQMSVKTQIRNKTFFENLFEKLLKLWLSGKSGNETAQTIQKLTLSINV